MLPVSFYDKCLYTVMRDWTASKGKR